MNHNPYSEGVAAYRKGTKRRDNPYHMATSAHELWDEGWAETEETDGQSNDN